MTDGAVGRPQWYCLRCKPNAEWKVQDALRARSLDAFLPTYTVATKWTDRTKLITKPLFPGYIFCRFDPAIDDAAHVSGVVNILGTDRLTPSPIPDEEIESCRIMAEFVNQPASPCRYLSGERVLVERGPLSGVVGTVHYTKAETRIFVAITILNREVSVEIDAGDLAHYASP
ncbi:MAG: UpxY family transcription antiterminator [Candidatus Velthaea sp.]